MSSEKWETVTLGDICDTSSGGTPSKTKPQYWEKGTIPWVKSGEVAQGEIWCTEETISQEGLKQSSAKLFPVNTVLVAMYGATVGQVGILKIEATTNQAVCGILPNSRVDVNFLQCYLKSKKKYIMSLAAGGAQPNISQAIIRNLKLPLPPLPEQRRIAAILDSADAIRQKRKAAIAKLDELAQSVFYEMFGDPVKNEKGWETSRISDICQLNPSKKEIESIPKNSAVTFLPMQYLNENQVRFDATNSKILSEVSTGSYTYFANQDILIAKVTPCFENGKAGIAKGLINGIGFGSSELHVIRTNGDVLPEYIYSILTSARFRAYASKRMTGTGGLRRVPIDAIANLEIAVPKIDIQKKYLDFCLATESMRSKISVSMQSNEALFSSLQHRAFAGEL